MNDYNPMNPEQDINRKYQWCIHTASRSSSNYKSLTESNWSLAGFIPCENNSHRLCYSPSKYLFYWRKPIINSLNFTPQKPRNHYRASPPSKSSFPPFKQSANSFQSHINIFNPISSPKSNSSTPALEVEENIVVEEDCNDFSNHCDDIQSLDAEASSPLCSINITHPIDLENLTHPPNINNPTSLSFFDTFNQNHDDFFSQSFLHQKKWR